MRILHIAETVAGGPASYLEELVPLQLSDSSNSVAIVYPREQKKHISAFNGFVRFEFNRPSRGVYSLASLFFESMRAIKSFRPDVIHLHSTFAGSIGRLAAFILGASESVVYCAHCWPFDRPVFGFRERVFFGIEKFLSRYCGSIVNISPHENDLLRKLGFPMDRVTMVLTGISCESICLGNEQLNGWVPVSDRIDKTINLLFVGRLDPQKGLRELALKVSNKLSGVSLTVVGSSVVSSGEGNSIFHSNNIIRPGWIDRSDLQNMLSSYDAVIMPSLWEGLPIIAIEVMRSGGVLAANNIGPFPFMIQSGVNGFIFDVADDKWFDEILDKISSMSFDDRCQISLAAINDVYNKYNSVRMWMDLSVVYNNLIVACEKNSKVVLG